MNCSVPAVSRISSMHCCPSTSTCFRYESSIVGSYFSTKIPYEVMESSLKICSFKVNRESLHNKKKKRSYSTGLITSGKLNIDKRKRRNNNLQLISITNNLRNKCSMRRRRKVEIERVRESTEILTFLAKEKLNKQSLN